MHVQHAVSVCMYSMMRVCVCVLHTVYSCATHVVCLDILCVCICICISCCECVYVHV